MKDYKLENYNGSLKALEKDVVADLTAEFADLTLESDTYKACEILEIVGAVAFNNTIDFIAEVSCTDGIKQLCLNASHELNRIKIPEDKLVILKKAIADYIVADTEFYTKAGADYLKHVK